MEQFRNGYNVEHLQARITDMYDGLPQRVKDYIKRDKELQDPDLPDNKRELYTAQREQLYFQIQETPDLIEPFIAFSQTIAELAYEKQQRGLD